MKLKKTNTLPLVMLLVPIFICLLTWYLIHIDNYTTVKSETSVWDLRGFSFTDAHARIEGPVEYIPNALLTPEEFNLRESEVQIGHPENVSQCATSRIRVLMPDNSYYALTYRSIDFAEKLYVNGVWIMDFGSPGLTKESNIPNTGIINITVQPIDGVIEIVQQGSNFVHRESSEHAGIRIGTPNLIRSSLSSNFRDNIETGCFLALFLVHIFLFSLKRTYRANIYFAIFCLMWFLRSGVVGSKLFTVLFPGLSWYAKFRIEYMTFPVTALMLVMLLNVLFPKTLQKWFIYVVYCVSVLSAGIFLFADTVFMSYSLIWIEGVYASAIIYIVVRFIQKLRNIKLEQAVFLIGIGLFFYAVIHDMFYYNGIYLFPFVKADMTQISMLIFTFVELAAVFIATIREVEEAKAEERRLFAQNAELDRLSRMRGELVSTVGHEMRTPLTVMSVYAQLATETLRESGADEQTTADLKMISSEAKRLADMASDVLQLSKKQGNESNYTTIALGEIIEHVSRLCTPMLDKNESNLTLEIQENLPAIFGSTGECTQLLWNLLTNAARHTVNGGITIHASSDRLNVIVAVTDTGEGIASELLSCVFERGQTGENGRDGLGLAICKDIVTAHGGEIEIVSTQSSGTTVTVTMPIYRGEIIHEK